MIEVTKLNGEKIIVNADHIESVEAQPDTALVLANGKRIVVREEVEEIVRRATDYQRQVRGGIPRVSAREGGEDDPAGNGGRRKSKGKG